MKQVVDGVFKYPYKYTLQTSLQRPYFGVPTAPRICKGTSRDLISCYTLPTKNQPKCWRDWKC